MLIFALLLAATPPAPAAPPATFTEAQSRDIGCVAVLGLVAYDQQRKAPGHDQYPDVRERGRKWAGQVGDRITNSTGLPQEVVAFAINEAVKGEQAKIGAMADPAPYVRSRVAECKSRMDADMLASQPLPKPVRSQ